MAVLVVGAAVGAGVMAGTGWGHARIARAIERAAADRLVPGARLAIGTIDGGLDGAWSADSVVLTDASGATVAAVAHVGVRLAPAALLRGEIRLGTITIQGLRATLRQGSDGAWNVSHLIRALPPVPREIGRAHV